MAPTSAVCIRCGHTKREGLGSCKACGFRPRTLDDRIRSLYLEPRVSGTELTAISSQELEAASSEIKACGSFAFDSNRLSEVSAEYKRSMRSLTISFSLVLGFLLAVLAFLYVRAS